MQNTVLIVDDSKFSRKKIKGSVEKLWQGGIEEAEDGVVGLEKFRDLRPKLIITDLEMPHMDGLEMITHIRKLDSDVSIILISSVVNAQMIEKVRKLGVITFTKPYDESELIKAIEEKLK